MTSVGNSTLQTETDFYLFETLYGVRETGLRHLERHLARLDRSARSLGFKCQIDPVRREALKRSAELPPGVPHRVRISLDRSGEIQIRNSPMPPLDDGPVKLLLASARGFAPQHSNNPLLLHKTSLRNEYDRAWQMAESVAAFDMLFCNERGELTEGGRSNVFLRIDGRWWTPPLTSALLPGVMREVLLENQQFGAAERVLYLSDLEKAEELILCNSLRGVLQAHLR
jgi:branched-subunit amino acid aminotransferase/4-amino-4-deoxychorismate lyase